MLLITVAARRCYDSDHGADGDDIAVAHMGDAQLYQVTGSEFAIDREIEQGKFARSVSNLPAPSGRRVSGSRVHAALRRE
jgi:hypothetical protein